MTTKERNDRHYIGRSEWSWHNGFLLDIIQHALKDPNATAWQEWSVQSESRAICQYNFEDLDMDDQIWCVIYWKGLSQLKERLRPYLSSEQMVPIEEVIARLWSFTQQAQQLYGVYEFNDFAWERFLGGHPYLNGDTGINASKE